MSCFRFGPFTLFAARRQLFVGDRETKLGARALDLLVALVTRAGEVAGKQDLMAIVWPHEVVEENTLRVHMAALRKALASGDPATRYIASIPGRGYSFVVPAVVVAATPHPPATAPAAPYSVGPYSTAPHPTAAMPVAARPDWERRLPRLDFTLLGRQETIATLDHQLARHGVVSLVGPGGIGKTSVAIAVARQVAARHPQGIWFIDLTLLPQSADTVDVALAVARAIGLEASIDGLYPRLGRRLGEGRQLLILDNCEHVVKATAGLVEIVLAQAPSLRVLSTSREPLRATREQVHLLPCLSTPAATVASMREALRYPAIELFIQRALAADHRFEASDADAVWIAHICQGLDGVPLAIEHAAAMVRAFGLKGLAASLDDRFLLLCGARRTAISRHQNLEALLSWGYELLTDPEQRLLRWLSVFRGPMRLSDILALVTPDHMEPHVTLGTVHSLVLKSWLFPSAGGDAAAFRLHAVARAFAHQRLLSCGEPPAWLRRPRGVAAAAPPPEATVRPQSAARLNG